MTVKLADIPPILRVADICQLLRCSESTFYELRARGEFGTRLPRLIEVLPAIDRHVRYSGLPFAEWLDSKNQIKLLRQAIRAVEDSGLARASGND